MRFIVLCKLVILLDTAINLSALPKIGKGNTNLRFHVPRPSYQATQFSENFGFMKCLASHISDIKTV